MQSSSTFKTSSEVSLMSSFELTAKDGLFIATECHLASLPDEDGDTALHLAIVREDWKQCKRILELFSMSGKSIDIHNNLLQTPLHVAIITNQCDMVELLMIHKSNPYEPDRYGSTAFHLCAKYNSMECLMNIFEDLGKRKLNLNIRDYEGVTPLHVAVINGSVATFKVLVANGADIDAKDNKGGRTPLIYAIEKNDKNIVEMLLECDASVSQQTYSGDTALHIASGRGLQDIVRLLLRRGADATMKNTHYETPISLATSPSVTDILRSPYKVTDSPDSKSAQANADIQYASYIARHTAVPMPPQLLRMMSNPTGGRVDEIQRPQRSMTEVEDRLWRKRGKNIKKEFRAVESDDEIPTKRYAMSDARPSGNVVAKGTFPVVVPVPPTVTSNIQEKNCDLDAENSDDVLRLKEEEVHSEEVEVVMEEIVTEEIVVEKSDEMSSNIEQTPENNAAEEYEDAQDLPAADVPESTSTMSNRIKMENNKAKNSEEYLSRDGSSEAVIVQRQPEITHATALAAYRTNYSTGPSYRNFSPSISPISYDIQDKSKSVPSSPQPSEANLYQLAREGLAVAAMANSSSYQMMYRDFNVSNYLKSRPSRQAKIKSGTEELQNLALQGLAVAAMSSAQSTSQKDIKQDKDAEDTLYGSKSSLTTVPKHLSKILHPTGDSNAQFQPQLFRSTSLPPKYYYEEEAMHQHEPFKKSEQAKEISSGNALLALAYANARKENVGQAVSAISMGKPQIQSTSKQQGAVPSASCDVSENTKINLRQAIMVKNTGATPKKPVPASVYKPLKVHNPKNKEFKVYDPNYHEFKIYDPTIYDFVRNKTSKANIPDFLSQEVSSKKSENSNTISTTCEISFPGSLSESTAASQSSPVNKPKKPVNKPQILISKVINVKLPAKSDKDTIQKSPPTVHQNVSDPNDVPRSCTNFERSIISVHPTIALLKPTKEATPTNTVAPILNLQQKSTTISNKMKQDRVVSVTLGSIPVARISNSSSVHHPHASVHNNPLDLDSSVSRKDATLSTISSEQPSTVVNTSSHIEVDTATSVATLPTPTTVAPSVPMVLDPMLMQSRLASSAQALGSVPQMAAMGVPSPLVLNPALTNLDMLNASHGSAPYVQHQINYLTFGKEYLPVLMPIGQPAVGALHPQFQLPQYAFPVHKQMLDAQASQSQGGESSGNTTTNNPTQNFNSLNSTPTNTYLNNVPSVSISPSLFCQMPTQDMLLNQARLNSQLYSNPMQQQLDILQQQYLRSALLFQQQNLLLHNKSTAQSTVKPFDALTTNVTKPMATITAVPVQNHQSVSRKKVLLSPEDQPLNLSKKEEQPLNLMKSPQSSATSSSHQEGDVQRSSVIKVASSWQNQQSTPTTLSRNQGSTLTNNSLQQHINAIRHPNTSVIPPRDHHVHHNVMLPPPLIIPGAVPPASVPSLSLPPIHYVNGMPFVLRYPPSV